MMDNIRWEQIQALFHKAVDLPADEQDALLVAASSIDAELVDEVRAMLREDSGPVSVLDRSVAAIARDVLNDDSARYRPQDFGPYRLLRLLGEGGMGLVYLAERTDLGTQVAIKILRDAWLSPARRERFASEQRILAQLNHPFIARLYDADTLPGGTPWIAMEYVEGVPLTQYCRARGAAAADRLRAFRSVCEGVEYAHRHMVVHRDLKPSNILVTADGRVKLLDFGISRQIDSSEKDASPTVSALRLLTPAYASPEQI